MNFTVILCITYITLNFALDLSDPKKKEAAIQCAMENGANAKQLSAEKLIFKEIFQGRDYTCWRKCYYVKMGYISELAHYNIPQLMERFSVTEGDLLTTIRTCDSQTQTNDLCEKIYGVMTCIFKIMRDGLVQDPTAQYIPTSN